MPWLEEPISILSGLDKMLINRALWNGKYKELIRTGKDT
jgi:hypothetical protein